MKKIGFAIALSAAMTTTAMAEGMYFGAGVSQLNLDADGTDLGDSMLGTLIIGKDLTENFAIEGMIGTSLSDAEYSYNEPNYTENRELSVSTALGIYAVAKANMTEKAQVYAKVGFTKFEVEGKSTWVYDNGTYRDTGSDKSDSDDDDMSFGLGARVNVTENGAINLEYMNWYDKDGGKIDGFGVSYVMNF